METYIAFSDKEKAMAFERYLKTGSGREFSRRLFFYLNQFAPWPRFQWNLLSSLTSQAFTRQ